jgi:hypothetical protein
MPNKENIKKHEYKKGQSGNPNGRPKGTENSKTRLMRLFSLVQSKTNPVTGAKEEFSVLEQMDMALVAKALKGDVRAYNELMDRFEGKPEQTVKNEGVSSIKIVRK